MERIDALFATKLASLKFSIAQTIILLQESFLFCSAKDTICHTLVFSSDKREYLLGTSSAKVKKIPERFGDFELTRHASSLLLRCGGGKSVQNAFVHFRRHTNRFTQSWMWMNRLADINSISAHFNS